MKKLGEIYNKTSRPSVRRQWQSVQITQVMDQARFLDVKEGQGPTWELKGKNAKFWGPRIPGVYLHKIHVCFIDEVSFPY